MRRKGREIFNNLHHSLFTSLNATSIGGNGGSSINPSKGDPNIKPETSSEFEFGFDVRILNKITLEATYYARKVKDLILSRGLPTSTGFSTETTNLADLENRGLELSLNVNAFDTDNFKWNSGVQYWFNKSEITRLV